MKFSCTQENFQQGLSIVSHLAGRNTNLAILSNILICVQDKLVTLSATNLEIGVSTQVRASVETEGSLAVDAHLLAEYVNLLPRERIELEVIDGELFISCGSHHTKIKGVDATDFPLLPTISREQPFIVSPLELRDGIQKVAFAAAHLETRPQISGVCLNFSKNKLITAATDGYRLAEYQITRADEVVADQKVIVPAKTLQEISRIIGVFKDIDATHQLELYVTDNQLLASYNGTELISRLIEGNYPEYEASFPERIETNVIVPTDAFIKAVKTVGLFTQSGVQDIRLELQAPDSVMVSASSVTSGESQVQLSAQTNNNLIVILNYRFLLDGLQNCSSDEISLEFTTPNDPCLLKPQGSDVYRYIIMPIKQDITA